jgi:ABC-type amino acid transport substrate-binding protein
LGSAVYISPQFAEAGELTAVMFEIEPWGYRDNAGKLAGIQYDIIMAISDEMKESITIKLLPYKRMIRHLEMGVVDFAMFYRSAKSERSGEPVARWGALDIIVVSRTGTDFNTYEDLQDKTIAVRLGGYFDPRFDKDTSLKKHNVTDYAQGVRMLMKDRVDCLVGTATTLYYELGKQGVSVSELGVPLFLSQKEDWVHFSRKSANQDKKEKLAMTVDKLVTEGVFNRIFSKHLPKEWQHR